MKKLKRMSLSKKNQPEKAASYMILTTWYTGKGKNM
jgi:hypothetical protein